MPEQRPQPDQSLPETDPGPGRPSRPDQGLPGDRPDQGGDRPDQGLPGQPGRPTTLPTPTPEPKSSDR
jgi:hypothetical protein